MKKIKPILSKNKLLVLIVTGFIFNLCILPSFTSGTPLPFHSLNISCDFYYDEDGRPLEEENDSLHAELESSLIGFINFAEKYQGQAVYVEFSIEASDSSGSCNMFDRHIIDHLPKGKAYGDFDIKYGIQSVKNDTSSTPNLNIWSRASMNGGIISVSLPNLSLVPTDGLFILQKFRSFFTFKGPVVMHYTSGNGFDGAEFIPIKNSIFFWQEVSKIRLARSK